MHPTPTRSPAPSPGRPSARLTRTPSARPWVFGDAHTHDRLVRDLALGAHAAVVFLKYDRSPEARYPHALEQVWATAQWIVVEGATKDLDTIRLAVTGDSVGGNMTAALTLLAKERGGLNIAAQLLFYPVTDANFSTL